MICIQAKSDWARNCEVAHLQEVMQTLATQQSLDELRINASAPASSLGGNIEISATPESGGNSWSKSGFQKICDLSSFRCTQSQSLA